MSLQSKFFAYFLIIALTPILIISAYSFFETQNKLASATTEHLSSIANLQKERVSELLDRYIQEAKLIASKTQLRLSIAQYNKNSSISIAENINALLDDTKNSVSDIYTISVINLGGTVIASTDSNLRNSAFGSKENLLKGQKAYTIIGLFKDKNNQLRFELVGPIVLDGKIIGVVDIISSADLLISVTEDYTGLGKTGEVVLAEKNQAGDALFLTPLRFNAGAAFTQVISSDKTDNPMTQALQGKEEVFTGMSTKDYRGTPIFAVTRFIPATGWGLVAKIDREEALAPASAFRDTFLLIILFSLFIIVGLSLFISNTLASPLIRLTIRAKALAALDFTTTTTTTTTTSSNDEIGQLARVFNDMVGKLKSSYTTLEKKVRDRTQDLEEVKAKDEAILTSIGDAVMACDKDGRVMLFNSAASALTGFSIKEVIGQHYRLSLNFAKEGEEKSGNDFIAETIKTGQGKKMENHIILITKDGRKVPVADSAAPIKNAQGEIIGCVLVFRDMTKDREIDKAKTEFVSLASHQLRTPLGIMKWYLEVLQKEDYLQKAPQQTKEYFDEVFKNNERVLSLVRDLLSVSRIEQGRVKNAPKQVNILEIVTDTVTQMQILAKSKKVTLHLTLKAQKLPSMYLDPLRFHEVIENLVTNAIEYTQALGKVEVTVDEHNDTVTVSIQDTGMGISAEDKSKLFDKFFRSQEAVTSNPEGSGLGLYVVKSYVEQWGGKISVESVEGKGSTFTVSLPIAGNNEKGLAPLKAKGGDNV